MRNNYLSSIRRRYEQSETVYRFTMGVAFILNALAVGLVIGALICIVLAHTVLPLILKCISE